jgi:protein TonB
MNSSKSGIQRTPSSKPMRDASQLPAPADHRLEVALAQQGQVVVELVQERLHAIAPIGQRRVLGGFGHMSQLNQQEVEGILQAVVLADEGQRSDRPMPPRAPARVSPCLFLPSDLLDEWPAAIMASDSWTLASITWRYSAASTKRRLPFRHALQETIASPMRTSALLLAISIAPSLASAGEPPTAAQSAAGAIPAKVRAVSLRPTDEGYPPELAAKGVQGTAELLLKLGADGNPTEVSVQSTSRSKELDQAAMAVARGLSFKAKDPANPVTQVLVPIEFLRDSPGTLSNKTCQEFNVDLAYFKATFPELEVRNMPVVNMTVGSYVSYGIVGLSQDRALAYMKRVETAATGIVEACAKEPEAGYTKTFTKLVKDAG